MSATNTPNDNMPVLEALMILDSGLTISNRILAYLNDKRMRGELTPEEEAAVDARHKAIYADPAWQRSTAPKPPTP